MKNLRTFPDSAEVPIVRDGAIAMHDIGEGRMVPVLIVDCTKKVELRDLILAHEESSTGDAIVTWGTSKDEKNKVILVLEFTKPTTLEVFFKFDVLSQGGVVDGMLHANAVYLQPEELGKRVVDGIGNAKILVEIPDTGFLEVWDNLYSEILIKNFRKSGLSKKEASNSTNEHKEMLRGIWVRRMKRINM